MRGTRKDGKTEQTKPVVMEVKGGTGPLSEKEPESKVAGQVGENEKLLKAGLDALKQELKQIKRND